MFAICDAQRRKRFVDVCIPSNEELFQRYGQSLLVRGSNDGTDFSESESSMRLNKVEMIVKAREYVQNTTEE